LSTYIILRIVENNINVLSSSFTVPDIFFPILTKSIVSRQIFIVHSIKFRENPSIGSRAVRCGLIDRWKDKMAKIIGVFESYTILIGQILCRNYLLRQVIEGKIKGGG
jgi:hypothetical protein